jgi:hypothetical protein
VAVKRFRVFMSEDGKDKLYKVNKFRTLKPDFELIVRVRDSIERH